MVVTIILLARGPAGKARALLERGIAITEQIGLRNAHLFQRGAQGGPGALAHADDLDVGRLDQRDLETGFHPSLITSRNRARGQPSSRAAAHHNDLAYHVPHLLFPLPILAKRMGPPSRRPHFKVASDQYLKRKPRVKRLP